MTLEVKVDGQTDSGIATGHYVQPTTGRCEVTGNDNFVSTVACTKCGKSITHCRCEWKNSLDDAARQKRIQRELDRNEENRRAWDKIRKDCRENLLNHTLTLFFGIFIGWALLGC